MVGFQNGTIDMNDPNRTIFLIPEGNMARLEREVAKLSKKAERFGGWTFDILPIGFQFRDCPRGSGAKIKLIEVCLDVEPIKIDGWRFLARIDHAPETGNIIRAVPNIGIDVEARFRTAKPDCEHCNHKRLRRDTFVLISDDGEYKQVGSTCLADFLGHDAARLGRLAELTGYANELARAIEREPADEPRTLQERRYIDLWDFLAHTAAMVRLNGWTSGKTAYEYGGTSTRQRALENMFPSTMFERREAVQPTQEDTALAKAALDWAQSFSEKAELNDYEHNVLVIAESSVIDYRSTGIAASIVGVYHTKNAVRRGPVDLGDMKPMLALFKAAGSKLKHPKINLNVGGSAIVLTVAGDRAAKPGTINVKSPGSYENSSWYGRIELDGSYKPSRQAPKGIEQHLLAFAADPAKVAAEHGHKTGQCCFCNRPLDDVRSTEVGYGPVCADKWQLPWGTKRAIAA